VRTAGEVEVRYQALGLSCFVFIASLGLAWTLHNPSQVHGPDDPSFYWRLAEGKTVAAPFGYRILIPWTVRVLPLDHHFSFVLVTALSVAVLAAALWCWGRRYASAGRVAAALAIILASGPVWIQLKSPYRNDVEMMALLAVAALCSDRRRWYTFSIIAVAAVATRDVAVIVAMVPLLSWRKERNSRALLAFLLTVTAFLAVRGLLPVIPRPLQHPSDILSWRASEDGGLLAALVFAFSTSFGAAWFLVPVSW
jgi:hypothetical protein